MNIGVYFCNCGTNVAEKIDSHKVEQAISRWHFPVHFRTIDFICSDSGIAEFGRDITEHGIERVVIAACSPRDHQNTFMNAMKQAGLNPYLMQMVNIREQIAWVTEDKTKATDKAIRSIKAALRRVELHEPLQETELEVCPDVLVIGAGPAGLKAALSLAESDRQVVLVERSPAIGGLPVRFEELFPNLECGPCLLEPLMGEILHGPHAGKIELLTSSEVVDVVGSLGNFTARINQRPRYVDVHTCIGCNECVAPCPVSISNEFDCHLGNRKAISTPFPGALPNAPSIEPTACAHLRGEDCHACVDACPVENTIQFDQAAKVFDRRVGAIVLASGGNLFDCGRLPNLGYGTVPDVYTSLEFERILASNGPTEGDIRTRSGRHPSSIAIIHCVGSLDDRHCEYCSGVCCEYAFKFNHLVGKRLPETKIYHFYKEIAAPGKSSLTLYRHAQHDAHSEFVRFADITDLELKGSNEHIVVCHTGAGGNRSTVDVDVAILCPALIPGDSTARLSNLIGADRDRKGFFEELHSRTDAARSTVKGVYLAGTCQEPMNIQRAMSQGMAATGYIASDLVVGRKLIVSPITAEVDEEVCSGCRICMGVCPYKAISFDGVLEVSKVNAALCHGCGTCVAGCPSGAMNGAHFTHEMILGEIEEFLR